MRTTLTKRGRKSIPHRTADGRNIDGLYRKPDGRWRITGTTIEYTEHDEDRAIERFYAWKRSQGHQIVDISVPLSSAEGKASVMAALDAGHSFKIGPAAKDEPGEVIHGVPQPMLMKWLRETILKRSHWLAEQVGIPQLAHITSMRLPGDPIPLASLIDCYDKLRETKKTTKGKVRSVWEEFVKHVGVTTLPQVTVEKFKSYRDFIKSQGYQPDTVGTYFTRVKTVIGCGLEDGMDEQQIQSALNLAKVLKNPKVQQKYQPTPVSRKHFGDMLKVVKSDKSPLNEEQSDQMYAALMLSLNACLYCSEALDVDWDEIDFDQKTYLTSRGKTGIIRAAYLWDETIAAMQKLPRKGKAVFVSERGSRFHPNSFRKLFQRVRDAAKVPESVAYNNIRDGAYTAACCKDVPFHLAQILGGHNLADNEADKYIARNPEMVRPACEAVYRHYFQN